MITFRKALGVICLSPAIGFAVAGFVAYPQSLLVVAFFALTTLGVWLLTE